LVGDPQVEVDADQLRAVAGAVARTADGFRRAHATREPDLAPDAGQVTGWSATAAARAAGTSWSGFLDHLTSSVDGLAADLRVAAESYDASDVAAADRLRKQYAE
jgi:hypothetical protein